MASNGNESSGSMPQIKDNDASHIEKPTDVETVDEFSGLDEISHEEHVKTFRKVDWHLMPMLMALYLIANLDRYVDLGALSSHVPFTDEVFLS